MTMYQPLTTEWVNSLTVSRKVTVDRTISLAVKFIFFAINVEQVYYLFLLNITIIIKHYSWKLVIY